MTEQSSTIIPEENPVTLAEMQAAHSFGASYPFCGYRTLTSRDEFGRQWESICIEPVGHNPDHTPSANPQVHPEES